MCYFKLYLCVNLPSDQKASGRYERYYLNSFTILSNSDRSEIGIDKNIIHLELSLTLNTENDNIIALKAQFVIICIFFIYFKLTFTDWTH